MTSRSEGPPGIETVDHSILTPDLNERALHPEPAPTGEPPNVSKLANLLGERADARHVALVGLFVLAVFYTLDLAQEFFLPIVLAVPMMVAFKITCDHIESLSPIEEFLGK
jgi:hypothetical protein